MPRSGNQRQYNKDSSEQSKSDLVGLWSVTDDSLNSKMHLFTDDSVRMESDVTAEYGTWNVEDGQLVLDVVIDDDSEEMRLDILSWNETQLRVETIERGERTLTRVGGGDATPANLPLDCSGGVKAGTQIAFGGYALPTDEIDSVAFDMRDRVPQIDLCVSETAALAIKAESAAFLGQPLQITLDGVLIAVPVTQEKIASRGLRIYFREATVPIVFDTLSADCLSN